MFVTRLIPVLPDTEMYVAGEVTFCVHNHVKKMLEVKSRDNWRIWLIFLKEDKYHICFVLYLRGHCCNFQEASWEDTDSTNKTWNAWTFAWMRRMRRNENGLKCIPFIIFNWIYIYFMHDSYWRHLGSASIFISSRFLLFFFLHLLTLEDHFYCYKQCIYCLYIVHTLFTY